MRIICPHCGERGLEEFTYTRDAECTRPIDGGAKLTKEWEDYVYFRDNLKGPRKEYWYHGAGCHAWIKMEREVSTHEIISVTLP